MMKDSLLNYLYFFPKNPLKLKPIEGTIHQIY